MQPFILYEREGAVVTLTMNRPDERNALTTASQFAEFPEVCERIRRDTEIRAVILTGAGPAFCAGGNVMDMRDKAGLFEGNPHEIRNRYRSGIQRIPLAIYELEVPTIAAVNGPAVGAGCDLACMCDIRIASERAMFAESFVKLGIIPGDGGAWFLPRAVGMSKAAEMTFTGDPVSAQEARSCGLVSKVVPADKLMIEARDLAGRIAANSGIAVRMAKRLLRTGQSASLETLLEMSAAFQAIAHHTSEHEDAVAKFFDQAAQRRK